MRTIKLKGTITTSDQAAFYRWFGLDAVGPKDITDALEDADGEDVTLEIASPGGTVVAGYEIYTALKKYAGKITAEISWACSAATLVACACDTVLISEAGVYMIHNTQGSADGDYRVMDGESSALQALNEGIINAYELKTGLSRDEIQQLMDDSTYMSPQKAIELKFADGFIGEEKSFDISTAAAGLSPSISDQKAKALLAVKQFIEAAGGEKSALEKIQQVTELPVITNIATPRKGAEAMTLEEFLNENPEAKAELDAQLETAKAAGVSEERDRMKSLDEIANSVPSEMLAKAKYEEPTDGKTLAYQALVEGKKTATAYMQNAVQDSAESGVDEVGVDNPDAGTDPEAQEKAEGAEALANAFKAQ